MVIGAARLGCRGYSYKMSDPLFALDFEIFGKVQGVFFRKCTEEEANKLVLRGWCKNTPEGTVQGQLEGPQSQINLMKHWLEHTGSRMSKIERANFKNERQIEAYTFENFGIRRKPK